MPVVGYISVLLFVVRRVFIVLAVAVPPLLFLILASALGPGGSSGGFAIILTLGLSALAWAFLPLVHAGPRSGLKSAVCWSALAALHVIGSAEGATGEVLVLLAGRNTVLGRQVEGSPSELLPPGLAQRCGVELTG